MLKYQPKKSKNSFSKKGPKNIFFLQKNNTESESDDDDEAPSNAESTKMKKITRDNNHIYFHAEVNRDNIFELIENIRKCEIDNIVLAHTLCCDPIPIYLHINSYGGCVFSAFTAIDIIKACKIPVYTVIEGATASAGTLMSVVGEKRYIRPNAHMLIHQLSSGTWGKMQELEDDFENNKALMEKIIDIYKDNAKIPKTKLKEILKHDLWWNVDTCMKYGLIDEIWTRV
jgi:ATP-dependent protease ClpP protease subunit|tara:strand:+ start:65419 stop:66105 length:687 start_codon:yes stop_codon:yes gene_type:complete